MSSLTGDEVIDADLAALADHYGVATAYLDMNGQRHEVPAASVVAVLGALDVDAATPHECRQALLVARRRHWDNVVPESVVVRDDPGSAEPWKAWVHADDGEDVRVWVELEDGSRRFDVRELARHPAPASVSSGHRVEVTFGIARSLPYGWHTWVAEVAGERHECAFVVCPQAITLPANLQRGSSWGIATQLYSVRSRRSWGIGDLADLSDLASWSSRSHGADFVLINPIHAAAPSPPMVPSPYLPVTRRFVNPIYLRVEAIPEFAYLPEAARAQILQWAEGVRAKNATSDQLDRDASWAAKRRALGLVHAVELTPGRRAEYADFRRRLGPALDTFSIWSALAEEHGPEWDQWPTELQDPNSAAVAAEALRLEPQVEFHRWLQWVTTEQLAASQQAARNAGMAIGIMHDLAVGVHKFGADTWSEPEVMARGVTVGAPPDAFNQVGQNWSQPPLRPDMLARTGFAAYRDMIRNLLRVSGGLRIDHVLGLFRQWWIPAGRPANEGTYVKFDHRAMVDILVLEAHRADAVVVGEDLGTVEPWVSDYLASRGILGTIVLFFEMDEAGPRPPERWRPDTLAAVTVHDLPPTSGYLRGSHVRLRAELGLLSREEATEQAAHEEDVAAWRNLLESKGLLRPGASESEVVVALHRTLAWSPSRLKAVSLADMVGDVRTQNQPGTEHEYPNWRVPLCDGSGAPVLLEHLPDSPVLQSIVSAIGAGPRHRS